ncbi:hypothetical protein R83H12_00004 [Fibrobacteria bacterium R8-3-H12]
METLLNFLINPQSLQTLLLAAIGCSGFVWLKMSLGKQINGVEASLNKRIDGVEASLNKRMDGLEASIKDLKQIDLVAIHARIDDLKHNDFAHLNATIEALTFTLEKNGFLKREDKEYVDSRLAR